MTGQRGQAELVRVCIEFFTDKQFCPKRPSVDRPIRINSQSTLKFIIFSIGFCFTNDCDAGTIFRMSGQTKFIPASDHVSSPNDSCRGAMRVFVGCMFSGKTTNLLGLLNDRTSEAVFACIHVMDDRYREDSIVSHGGKAYPAVAVRSAAEMLQHIGEGVGFVAIDEAHFFDASLMESVTSLVDRGVDVAIAALDRDSWGQPFPLIERLCTIANSSHVLLACCARCGEPADRTQRLTPIVDGCMVGGAESYEPRCQRCWHAPPESPPS